MLHRLSSPAQPAPFNGTGWAPVQLAVHFRQGDASSADPNMPTSFLAMPLLQRVVKLLKILFSPTSVLDRTTTIISFYSQGRLDTFSGMQEAFPETQFFLDDGIGLRTMDHFYAMMCADVIVASPSTFSALVAALNIQTVVLAPDEPRSVKSKMSTRFDGIPYVLRQIHLSHGNLREFNCVLCRLKARPDRRLDLRRWENETYDAVVISAPLQTTAGRV